MPSSSSAPDASRRIQLRQFVVIAPRFLAQSRISGAVAGLDGEIAGSGLRRDAARSEHAGLAHATLVTFREL